MNTKNNEIILATASHEKNEGEHFLVYFNGEEYQATFPKSLSDLSCSFSDLDSCEKYVRNIVRCVELWKSLGNVPIDCDGNIDEDWQHFDKGTDLHELWHWFEDTFPVSIATDLMDNNIISQNITKYY